MLLNNDGLVTNPAIESGISRDYVQVTGGQPGTDGAGGFVRPAVPGDTEGGRYVPNIVSIEAIGATVPGPPGGAMPVTALCGLRGASVIRRRAPRNAV